MSNSTDPVANGDACMKCGAFIFHSTGSPLLCNECKFLQTNPGVVSHSECFRCPKCKRQMRVDDGDDPSLYGDGDHLICCDKCGYEFEITTFASYTFISPSLL